jgi:palmitoyltransferase
MLFFGLYFLFIIFTSILCGYHLYLIVSGQTTWEHSGRMTVTYLRPYKVGIMPFYRGIWNNTIMTFCHGNQVIEWELKQPAILREE